jgi:hypothetical protein
MFGPQDEDDMINQIELMQLENIFPVINGLVFDNVKNC